MLEILLVLIVLILSIVYYKKRYFNIQKRYLNFIHLLMKFNNSAKNLHYEQKIIGSDNDIRVLKKVLNEIIQSMYVYDKKRKVAEEYQISLASIINNSGNNKKENFKKLDEYEKYFKNQIPKQSFGINWQVIVDNLPYIIFIITIIIALLF